LNYLLYLGLKNDIFLINQISFDSFNVLSKIDNGSLEIQFIRKGIAQKFL